MVKFIRKIVKQIFCKHDYAFEYPKSVYYDVTGYRVEAWRCHCTKCGKQSTIKYY